MITSSSFFLCDPTLKGWRQGSEAATVHEEINVLEDNIRFSQNSVSVA